MLVQTINSQGISNSVNYVTAGLDGVARKPYDISNSVPNMKNMVLNHSFEITSDTIILNSVGWQTNNSTLIKIMDGGVYGEKMLRIEHIAPTDTQVFQDIYSISPDTYKLIFLTKTESLTGTGKVVVETYNNVGTLLNTYTSSNITNATTNWSEFNVDGILITSGVYRMRVKIIGQQSAGYLYFDDFQLYPIGHKSSYNYISNGYFDNEADQQPVGFIRSNMNTSTDKLEEYYYYGSLLNNMLGLKVFKIQGVNNVVKSLSKQINLSGIAGDKFTFNVWALVQKFDSEILKAEVTFKYPGYSDQTFFIDFKSYLDYWQLASIGVVASKPYNRIDVKISYRGLNECLIDGLSLIRDNYSKHLNYDNKANMVSLISVLTSTDNSYENDKLISTGFNNGLNYKYTYNSSGKITQITDNLNNKIDFTYDSNGNRTISKVTASNNKFLQIQQTFDTENRVLTGTDELGNVTGYAYNASGLLSQITYPSGLIINNIFDKYNNLIQQINSKSGVGSTTYQYQYNIDRTIKKVITNDATNFNFEYDDFKRLIGIKIGSTYTSKYEYNDPFGSGKRDNLTKHTFGSNGDYYQYEYNSKSQLIEVKYNTSTLYKYEYDEYGSVTRVTGVNFVKYYSYDSNNKLVKETKNNGHSSQFEYDNFFNLQKIITDINGKQISDDLEYAYESNEYNKDSYKNRLDRAFGDDIIDYHYLNTGIYGTSTLSSYGTLKQLDSTINRYTVTLNKYKSNIIYDLTTVNKNRRDSMWNMYFKTRKTYYGWFKFSGTIGSGHKIFALSSASTERLFVTVSNSSNVLTFKLYRKSGSTDVLVGTSSKTASINEYVMIAIKVNSYGYNGSSFEMYINGETPVTGTTTSFIPDSINKLYIGDVNSSGSSTVDNPFKETLVFASIGSYTYAQSTFKAIYETGLKYLINGIIYYPTTGVSYVNADTYENMDVITLNGTLTSIQGVKPISLTYTDQSLKSDKAKVFEYESNAKKHVYGSYSTLKGLSDSIGKLVYKLALTTSGTISIRFKINNSSTTYRTILSSQNQTNDVLSYKVDTNNNLVAVVNNTYTSLNKMISMNVWHNLVICYTNGYIRTYIDNEQLSILTSTVNLTDNNLAIGCKISTANNYTPQEHLEGNLELLAYTSSYLYGMAQLSKIQSTKLINRVYNQLDSFGRIEKNIIQTSTNNSNNIEHTYAYFSPSTNRTSLQISSVSRNYNSVVDSYGYDNMGNIVSISKSEGIYQYQYDYLKRLIQEINPVNNKKIVYTYSSGNNISTVKFYDGTTNTLELTYTYSYDTTWKDRLLSVTKLNHLTNVTTTEYSIVYNTLYIGNPLTINGASLTFEGRKLLSKGTTNYQYDDAGNRTSKNVNGDVTNYYYAGNVLKSLTNGNNKLYFHHDEKGSVIGFEYNKNDYFFLRDLTGIITEIVNDLCETIVNYKYDAWGNWLNKDSASNGTGVGNTLVNLNPFIYKDYIYDSDSQWYYLRTRYYIPAIRNFLNSNDENATTRSSRFINMYGYSSNNPIMFENPTGLKQETSNLNTPTQSQSATSSGNTVSNNHFIAGILTAENNPNDPEWNDINAFYVEGNWGLYTDQNGDMTFAKIEIGVAEMDFYSSSLFSGLEGNPYFDPSLYAGVDLFVGKIDIGYGFDAKAEIIGGEAGVKINDALSVGVEGYIGWGAEFDLSNGIEIGLAIGAGGSISLEFDWNEVFNWFGGLFS